MNVSEATGGPTPDQLRVLAILAPALEVGSYLVGGVAVGLELHHRTSLDVDVFVPHDFDAMRLLERIHA